MSEERRKNRSVCCDSVVLSDNYDLLYGTSADTDSQNTYKKTVLQEPEINDILYDIVGRRNEVFHTDHTDSL